MKPKNNLQKQVEEYLHRDDVSIVTPDLKKAKKGIQYRLASLQELHQRFQVDESAAKCSYSQFTCYVPDNIVKPKPEDWGTCFCMTCLNPELKLESIKRQLEANVTIDMVKDNTHKQEVNDLIQHIKASGKTFDYLEWSKEGEKGKAVKATTYHSKKNALSSECKEFAEKVKLYFEKLYEHSIWSKSQYRRIAELKEHVKQSENQSKLLRIDWSENVDLYQTRQEKSQYYTTISAVINTAVLYDTSDKVQCFATISDVKSHKADATWASLTAIFKHIDFSNCHHLYISSDSPSSQYRNYKNVFLMKAWAVSQNIDVSWVFTETGHGKGPMDGVGGGIKRVVKDKIS